MLKLKIFMIGLFLALVGCDANVSAKEAATSSANTVEKHAKPGAGIKLLNPQPFFVTSPGVENLELQLATTADNGILQIDLTASEGLELVSTQAHYEFQLCKQLQVTGFPQVLMQTTESKFHLLARGFTDYETLAKRVDLVLTEMENHSYN